ncbi:MAG: SH3 domain-containing protein [Pseudomonadota bacterium]
MQVCSRPQNCACFRSGWILEPSITTTRSRRLRRTRLGFVVLACFLSVSALAKQTEAEKAAKEQAAQEKLLQVFVSEPYLELSTGPGRGYPVFHVVEREASVDVLFRRTDWFKVRTEQGVEGYARARDMRRTKLADGTPFVFNLGDMAGFTTHNWEIGIGGGNYGGASLINAYGAYSLTDNMKVEVTLSQFLGNFSNGYKVEAGITHVMFPEWRISPFLELGTGIVYVEPRATIVLPEDRTDQTAYAGAGIRMYLTRRFFLRADYRWHTVFTSRDDNQELEEWKVLIACFF